MLGDFKMAYNIKKSTEEKPDRTYAPKEGIQGREFGLLEQCVNTTADHREISEDDRESLTFFLELVREALVAKGKTDQ